ncbi:hypothetical protein FSP39_007632 [Pinctada imbricata]|uniref:Uncharacterized protein n=1 Tax=Pinctada imbricata TaxID=66713 RepID=A0AA88XQF0_PINIB|nr:hypothetical protein FSP39_007632 [Pinctada imbricata]
MKKRYSQEDDIKETRTLRGSEKMSTPVKHIDHQLKGHVGEMLSKLKDSVIGPTGIYGFIIQGTEVTVVALSAEEKYLEYLEKGSFPKKDTKGVTLKYSRRCNFLEKDGRLALVKTFCDLAELSLFTET